MSNQDMFLNRPVTMNPKNHLLEIEEHMYILDDVQKPNVFRNMFPYSEIPKIPFNDRTVPHNMPREIWITDTTFRDGQQSRAPYSTEQIVTIFDYLHKLGGPNGMIRASEFFLYSKKDRDAVYKCMERGYQFPEVTSWIRASREDFKLVKELGMIDKISITGMDNVPLCNYVSPTLTSVVNKNYERGEAAFNLLVDMIKNKKKTENIVLDTEIIRRESF